VRGVRGACRRHPRIPLRTQIYLSHHHFEPSGVLKALRTDERDARWEQSNPVWLLSHSHTFCALHAPWPAQILSLSASRGQDALALSASTATAASSHHRFMVSDRGKCTAGSKAVDDAVSL
jgi:hypothetical protein